MPQLKVPCPHCQQTTNLDSDKLPDQPVSFKCPHCKGKVMVEKAKLLAAVEAGAPVRPTVVSATPRATTPPAAEDATPIESEDELPPGAAIPPGMILGENPATVDAIASLLAKYDCDLERPDSVDEARDQILLEPPSLVVYVAGTVGAPPHGPMGPLIGIPPRERRKIFLVLVSDNLKTLDGNAAFMYGVNLCVNRNEISAIARAIYSGLDYHHRLYKPYVDAVAVD